jgi:hypothetical protein
MGFLGIQSSVTPIFDFTSGGELNPTLRTRGSHLYADE